MQLGTGWNVEPGGWLIQEEHLRIVRDRQSQFEAALLAGRSHYAAESSKPCGGCGRKINEMGDGHLPACSWR